MRCTSGSNFLAAFHYYVLWSEYGKLAEHHSDKRDVMGFLLHIDGAPTKSAQASLYRPMDDHNARF